MTKLAPKARKCAMYNVCHLAGSFFENDIFGPEQDQSVLRHTGLLALHWAIDHDFYQLGALQDAR